MENLHLTKINDEQNTRIGNDRINEIDNRLVRLFEISLDDLMNSSPENIKQKRDLVLIGEEFEKLFEIEYDEMVSISFQEKYEALVARGQDAVKVIVSKMRFVYRKSQTEVHKWKFEENNSNSALSGKTRKDRVVGHIINLIKAELDGTSYRAISETQHKTVDIFKNIINKTDGELTIEGEHKLMSLLTEFNAFDLINECLSVSKEYNPEVGFLEKVADRLSSRTLKNDNLYSISNKTINNERIGN